MQNISQAKTMHCKFPPRFYKKKMENERAGKPKTTQQKEKPIGKPVKTC